MTTKSRKISIPATVRLSVRGQQVRVLGTNDDRSINIGDFAKARKTAQGVEIERTSDSKQALAEWGVTRSLLKNMFKGVAGTALESKAAEVRKRRYDVLSKRLGQSVLSGKTVAFKPSPRRKWSTAESVIGGKEVLGRTLSTPLDAHRAIEDGFPNSAMHALVDGFSILDPSVVVDKALGISTRTLQRSREHPNKKLSIEQSSRLWATAELIETALRVFGNQEAVERWMMQPAIGLDDQRPIDLIATSAGSDVVRTFLNRLDYGVYT